MTEAIIDKTFKTRKELEEYEKYLSEKYILVMIIHKENIIGEPEVYGIDKILHFGERRWWNWYWRN